MFWNFEGFYRDWRSKRNLGEILGQKTKVFARARILLEGVEKVEGTFVGGENSLCLLEGFLESEDLLP